MVKRATNVEGDVMPKRKTPERKAPDEGCEDIRGAFGRVAPKHRKTEAELQEEEFAQQMNQAIAASREHQLQRGDSNSNRDTMAQLQHVPLSATSPPVPAAVVTLAPARQ